MDLQLENKRALVCGASRGLGYACAEALAREGAEVCIVSRTAESLETAAAQIRAATGRSVAYLAADITLADAREHVLSSWPDTDILVNNAAGPKTGNMEEFTREDWLQAVNNNMLAPIELTLAVIKGMAERKYGRIVNISSAVIKAPVAGLALSTGARLGLSGFVSTLAKQYANRNVTINNLLPGAFLTQRLRDASETQAKRAGTSADELLAKRLATIPAARFGIPEEFGSFCAYLCGIQAGYITAQNLVIDGGAYPGVF